MKNPLIITLMLTLCSDMILHPTTANAEGEWQIEVAPLYLWALGVHGSQFTNQVPPPAMTQPIDISFSDVVNQLDLAGSFHIEARKGKWGVLVDVSLVDIEGEEPTAFPFPLPGVPAGTPVEVRTGVFNSPSEVAVMRRLRQGKGSLEILAGIRYTITEIQVSAPELPLPPLIDVSEEWLDPYVGLYYRSPLSERWSIHLRGDIGGFGLDSSSELTWHVDALVGYRLNHRAHFLFGYRIIDYDFDEPHFKFNVEVAGPILGVALRFGHRNG